jgi:hypothetical protein
MRRYDSEGCQILATFPSDTSSWCREQLAAPAPVHCEPLPPCELIIESSTTFKMWAFRRHVVGLRAISPNRREPLGRRTYRSTEKRISSDWHAGNPAHSTVPVTAAKSIRLGTGY